jgi:uncharacterized protein (DUF1800 family)
MPAIARSGKTLPMPSAGANPADPSWIAHLLRRAGFGGPPAEIASYAAKGAKGAVDALVDYEQTAPMDDPSPSIPGFDPNTIQSLRQLWVIRMARSPRPLEEKMTLFWHNHFATSVRKVNRPLLMWQQNSLFRSHATGNFRALMQDVAKDPAMILWLDTNTSRRARPNENFARELMELFTMGIGNYSEQDIKESARAFTGWELRDEKYFFNRQQFDDGVKTYHGQTGRFTGEQIVDIAVSHSATARFITAKLYRFFVDDNPSEATVERLAKVFVDGGYEIKPVLREIFLSPEFTGSYHQKVKWPHDLVIGAARTLELPVESMQLAQTMAGLGQDLFAPPTVKGWHEGPEWISASSVLLRVNWLNTIVSGRHGNQPTVAADLRGKPIIENPNALIGLNGDRSVMVDLASALLVDSDLTSEARDEILKYAAKGGQGNGRRGFEGKTRGVLHLLMSTPAYQLN